MFLLICSLFKMSQILVIWGFSYSYISASFYYYAFLLKAFSFISKACRFAQLFCTSQHN